ncbi:MAG: winged helix-turn-helix transcriptional regulator [Thermoleophilia bacterium]
MRNLPRTLDDRLGRLVVAGYVARELVGSRPRYRLTARGEALLPILDAMRAFGHAWLVHDRAHRASHHEPPACAHGPGAPAARGTRRRCGPTPGRGPAQPATPRAT